MHLELFAYGPTLLANMVQEIRNSRASLNYKLHLVPTCFFEGASHHYYYHGPDEEIPTTVGFFSPNPPDSLARMQNYIDPLKKNHSTFGFHWHNQWDRQVSDTSMAHAAEKLYGKLLNIKLP